MLAADAAAVPPSGATSSSAIWRKNSRRAAPLRCHDARRWFWRQTVRCLAAPPRARRHASASSHSRERLHRAHTSGRLPLRATGPFPRAFVRARRRRASWRWASAPTPPSSASSMRCCCGRCRSRSRTGSSGCSTRRRRTPSPACRGSRCRRPTSTTGSATRSCSRHGHLPVPAVRADRQRRRAKRCSREPSERTSSRSCGAQPALGRVFLAEEDLLDGRVSSSSATDSGRRHLGAAAGRHRPHADVGRRGLHDRRRHAGAVFRRIMGRDGARHLGAARATPTRPAPSVRITMPRSSRG